MSAAGTGAAGIGAAGTGAAGRGAGREFDFLVVGAGVTGTTMAALLIRRGLASPGRVALIAPAVAAAPPLPESEWDLRVFALGRSSQRLLTLAGAWARLPPDKVSAYERMCVWDMRGEPGGAGSLSFDAAEIGEPNLGFIVEGRALAEHCRGAAHEAGVVFIEAGIAALEVVEPRMHVALDDGRHVQAPLLIAADGVDSPTRKLLGIETAGHAYTQDALVAHVRTARPHRQTAWQRFLPGGPLAFLPLPDGRSSIVWSAPHAEAATLSNLDAAAFGAALTAASGEVLGACQLTTPLARFPLKLQYASHYVTARAALVGDAAHAVHPLAGQGLNLGLLDCAALIDVLGGGGSAQDGRGGADGRATPAGAAALGETRQLRRYERWRRSENLLAVTAMDGLERLFGSDNAAVAQLRFAGLSAVARMPLLRRRFAQQAMGAGGDIPEFLKGDAIAP